MPEETPEKTTRDSAIPFSLDEIDHIKRLTAETQSKSAELKERLQINQKQQKALEELLGYLERGWPIHAQGLLEKNLDQLKQLEQKNDPAPENLEDIFNAAADLKEKTRKRFPGMLNEACVKAGIEIGTDSAHPKYYFRDRFLTLEISDLKAMASLQGPTGKIKTIPADVLAIVDLLETEISRLFGRGFDGQETMEVVRSHYLKLIKSKDKLDGDGVAIKEIADSISAESKNPFRLDEFILDVSWLLERGPLEIEGRRIDLQQTKDTSLGILLYGMEGSGMVGYIQFRETKG